MSSEDATIISLPAAILLAGPGLGRDFAYKLAKRGLFPGQVATIRGLYRVNREDMLAALAAGWTPPADLSEDGGAA